MKIIQIGANSGKDHVFDFIKDKYEQLTLAVLIEPIPFIISDLEKQYHEFKDKIYIENIAISHEDNLENMVLYYLKDSNYEVTSFSKEHVIIHRPPDSNFSIEEMEVPCLTVNQILEKYNLSDLDYLYIDTEGLDVYIISSINFEKYDIKNIIFEATHTDGAFRIGENYNQTILYLQQLGYEISQLDSLNLKATKHENNI
jgi:FkbM family methyltransferase